MEQVIVIYCLLQSSDLHKVCSTFLSSGCKSKITFDNISPVFAACDCKTVHIACLRRNFVCFLSPAAEDILLLLVPASISEQKGNLHEGKGD